MAIEFLVAVTAKIGEYLIVPIGRPFGYVIYYHKNINTLKNRIPNLANVQIGVQGSVNAADRAGELILPNVQDWLTRVDLIAQESTNFFSNEVKENPKCLGQFCCLDLKSRYQVSKKAKKKTLIVDKLLHDGKFDRVSYPAHPPPLWSASLQDVEVFESRKSTFEGIMEVLQDDKISIIGVYGMGGIGKTTIVKEVANQAMEYKLFDEIVITVISHLPSVRKIQGDIADMLGLNLKEENELVRASRLRERLKQVKRVLVILDDLWTLVDLEAVGIPHGHVHNGCKILLTSRNLDVCNEMNSQINFPINVLSDMDSWNLFKKMTNDRVDLPDLYPIATKVAKECAGLPIAIVTVARALRDRSKHAWSDALRQLRNSTPRNIKGMYAKVYSSLELSYNFLENEELKSCFLLCSLFKEDMDIPIEYLVRYGMGLGLFQNVYKLDEARDRTHTLVDNLKAACLLLDGENEESIRMHDVIRDFSISVASNGGYVFLASDDSGFIALPTINTLNHCSVMSLVATNIAEFPAGLNCPKLQFCLLESYSGSVQIQDNLFELMKELKVLQIRHMSVPSIPQLLSSLKNLRALCLERCKLGDISLVGEFKDLEILSLIGSEIKRLPKKIGQLAHLRLLDMTDCENLTQIPPNVISRLSRLECLCMRNSFANWGTEGRAPEGNNATLAELKCLPCLSTLEVHIPDVKLLPQDLSFENLVQFRISIGGYFSKWIGYSYPQTLRLRLDQDITLQIGLSTLLKRAQHLILDYPIIDYVKDLKNVVHNLKREGFANLKCLEVYGYNEIEYLVDTRIFSVIDISILEKLKVASMANLKEICYGPLPTSSFSNLRELRLSNLPELMYLWKDPAGHAFLGNLMNIYVFHCHKIENLFLRYAAKDLRQLQTLHIWSCQVLKEIFSDDSEGITAQMNEIVLSKLNSLKLEVLPNLRSFWPEMDSSPVSNGSPHSFSQEYLFNTKVCHSLPLSTLCNAKFNKEFPSCLIFCV